jgi:hypothetical protein
MDIFKECVYNIKLKELVIEEGSKVINDSGVWEDIEFTKE